MRTRLINARLSNGYTQEDIAKYLGITKRQYQRIESGEILFVDMWDLLEDKFNIPQRKLRDKVKKPDCNQAKGKNFY